MKTGQASLDPVFVEEEEKKTKKKKRKHKKKKKKKTGQTSLDPTLLLVSWLLKVPATEKEEAEAE